MPEDSDRLVRCFASVFPGLPAELIPTVRADTLPEWTSLAAVTLMALVEEEFAVRLDILELPELDSFTAIEAYLRGRSLVS
jgi:acyl carrier protein